MTENYTYFPSAKVVVDNNTGECTIEAGQPIKIPVEVEINGSTSDGYHTFDELYEFRMLYHAAFVNAWENAEPDGLDEVYSVKSWKHSDGEPCFGGGWFIVVTTLPTGQISNHYEAQHWNLFNVPEVETPPEFDGHTAADVLFRLQAYLSEAR